MNMIMDKYHINKSLKWFMVTALHVVHHVFLIQHLFQNQVYWGWLQYGINAENA